MEAAEPGAVFLVTGFDVGGNSGATIEAVFTCREDAEAFALRSKHREWNGEFWPGTGHPFDVEEHRLFTTLEAVADQMLDADDPRAAPEWIRPKR